MQSPCMQHLYIDTIYMTCAIDENECWIAFHPEMTHTWQQLNTNTQTSVWINYIYNNMHT